jgi:hypothetical protein
MIKNIYFRIIMSLIFGLMASLLMIDFSRPCTRAVEGEKISQCREFVKLATSPDKILFDSQIRSRFIKNGLITSLVLFVKLPKFQTPCPF